MAFKGNSIPIRKIHVSAGWRQQRLIIGSGHTMTRIRGTPWPPVDAREPFSAPRDDVGVSNGVPRTQRHSSCRGGASGSARCTHMIVVAADPKENRQRRQLRHDTECHRGEVRSIVQDADGGTAGKPGNSVASSK